MHVDRWEVMDMKRSDLLTLAAAVVVCAGFGPGARAAFMITDNLAGNNDFSELERTIIREAQRQWTSRIRSINAVGRENFTIDYSKTDAFGNEVLAAADMYEQDQAGKPLRARIRVNRNLEGSQSSFLDQTPGNNSEFMQVAGFPAYYVARENVTDPRTGFSVSTLIDFYSTAIHEIGHALGFTIQYSRFADRVGAPTPGGLRRFTFENGDFAVLTESADGTHTVPGQIATLNGMDYDQTHDLMNPVANPGERLLPSELVLAMMAQAYGYKLTVIPSPAGAVVLAVWAAAPRRRRGA
ncbi:MAG: hypothetical protein SFZ24_04800 [Planctomycetota bacterium]|nr:hypothetical protein [Planctomycetota bacterium]